jgi:hypothetical protein
MKNQPKTVETAASGRAAEANRSFSGLTLVASGALAPIAVIALVVGAMLTLKSPSDDAAVATASETLDCQLPRNAWRSACQSAAKEPGQASTAVAAVDEGPATTGTVDTRKRRSSSIRSAADEDADRTPEGQVRPDAPATAAPKPVGVEAASSVSEPPRVNAAARAAEAAKPAAEAVPAPETSPSSVKESALSGRIERTRGEARKRVALRATVKEAAARPTTRARVVERREAAASPAQPRRLVRSRIRAAAAEEARVARRRTVAVAQRKAIRQRSVVARAPGGLRVTSTRSYILPDGREITVRVTPRAGEVRALMAQHAAAFPGGRAPAAWLARPMVASGWFSGFD